MFSFKIEHDMMLVKLDGHDYAIIDSVSDIDQVDIDKITDWINNTCDEDDYRSSFYEPTRLNLKEFKKD